MSARDDVLDAFEAILVAQGDRAATLDAVAAAAQVSKGGLLYHFRTREALVEGLVERLVRLTEADVAAMRDAPQGPSAYYVGTATFLGSPLDRALLATARLTEDATPSCGRRCSRSSVAGTSSSWRRWATRDRPGDPAAR